MQQDNLITCEIYQDKVNIELFNETISFVIDISPSEKISYTIRNLRQTNLWYQNVENVVPDKYRVRYFGELLERFEERIGNNIKDIRALALALAYCSEIIVDEMFVGNQKIDFIRKVQALAEEDLYLKGALFLLDEKQARQIFQSIADTEYNNTEDLLFALSLFEDYAFGFEHFKPQLLKLFGAERTVSVFQNAGLYIWFLKQSETLIRQSRKKDMRLCKALLQVRESFIKPETSAYKILQEQGYSHEEILYLNFILIDYLKLSNKISADGITGEKIAVEFCKCFLNSTDPYSENIYWLINQAFQMYQTFEIKCYECKEIREVLRECIAVQNAETFLYVYEFLGTDCISGFDVLDSKWDILAAGMKPEAYLKLFDNHLIQIEDDNLAQQWMEQYQILTNESYINTFKRDYRWRSFQYLVSHAFVRLEELFEAGLKDNSEQESRPYGFLKCVSEYVRHISTIEVFRFWEYFFSKYKNEDIIKLLQISNFENAFIKREYGYISHAGYQLNIDRDFLAAEEKLQLFNWGERYFFEYKPEEYSKYILAALRNDCIRAICPHEELRNIYLFFRETDPDLVNHTSLKEYFLTSEELQEEEKCRREAEEEQKRHKEQECREKLLTELTEDYQHSWETLYRFLDKHEYSWNDDEIAFEIAVPKFKELFDEVQPTKKSDFSYFLSICKMLIKKEQLSVAEILEYMKNIDLSKEDFTNETSIIAS